MKAIAIITGATGGLGRAFVNQLISEVDEIWAIARNLDKLKALENDYEGKVIGMSVDLSDTENLSVIKEKLQSGDYLIKYLVNNAGAGRMAPTIEFSDAEIKNHIMTHNVSLAILCNMCISYMNCSGHILNIASQSAFQPTPYINLYGASKAFTVSYSRALNMELQQKGIHVMAVCPGWIETELLETERNGVKVKFPHLAKAEDVAKLAVLDAKRKKDVSVYGGYVKWQRFLAKIFPHHCVMKTWLHGIKDYI